VSCPLSDDLFATSASLVPKMQLLGGHVPVIIIDGVYRDPARVREEALSLEFERPPQSYPGRIADIDDSHPTIAPLLRKLLRLVNGEYLPRVPPIVPLDGAMITSFSRVTTDFGIIDVPPDELQERQRTPHVDPVAIFGLLYLNEEERGGTMFFQPESAPQPSEGHRGYFREGDRGFRLIGKIEGRYNRLVIYPGFVHHSGEITGEWIEAEERRTYPRLTQRFLFYS